jgi:hypothetical protein
LPMAISTTGLFSDCAKSMPRSLPGTTGRGAVSCFFEGLQSVSSC